MNWIKWNEWIEKNQLTFIVKCGVSLWEKNIRQARTHNVAAPRTSEDVWQEDKELEMGDKGGKKDKDKGKKQIAKKHEQQVKKMKDKQTKIP